ncbi:MAG: TetR/AcrR family transcriptional regulator [Prevotella sp.]|jgi:AcrR family transcriptional regulator
MEEKNIEQQIIQAAKAVFIEKGFAEASMTDIAQRTGINRPVLNYYFRTKDKLFAAVFADILHDFIPRLKDVAMRPETVDERIASITDIYMSILRKEPLLPLFMIREIHRDAAHLFSTLAQLDSWDYIENLKTTFKKEMDAGVIRRVPLPHIFYTFYGLVAMPFLTAPLVELFVGGKLDDKLLIPWRQHIIDSMHQLLVVDDKDKVQVSVGASAAS